MITGDRPITLITATPGGGKTALTVKLMKDAVDQGRPLFVMGIPDLLLPHAPCPPISEWTELRPDPDHENLMLPYFTFPPNSLVVLDEAQRVFRVRASSSKVPDHVAAFETVRHTGVTFILITQHPNFLDSHIRHLVGVHVHLRDVGLLGRHYYEWPEAADPKTFATAPIKKKFKLPKEIFGLYKSSSLHIKRRYTVPPALVLLLVAIVGVLVVGYHFVTTRVMSSPVEAAKESPTAVASAPSASAPPPASPSGPAVDPAEILVEFDPTVPGRPESAPAYNALRVAKVMPVVVGCYTVGQTCKCQNQQGLDAGLDNNQCRAWLARPPFNPYREPENDVVQADRRNSAGRPEPVQAAPQLAVNDGGVSPIPSWPLNQPGLSSPATSAQNSAPRPSS